MPIQMQKQQVRLLIVAAILAIITAFLVKVYITQQKQQAMQAAKQKLESIQANQKTVLIAKQDIMPGKAIDPEMISAEIVMNNMIEPRAVSSLARIDGMIAATVIRKGEQITLDKAMYPRRSGGLSEVTPIGKRAITISVDNLASLAGMIKPGDYVDVISLVTTPMQTAEGKQSAQVVVLPLFQNVQVLAIGQETGSPALSSDSRYKQTEKSQPSSPLITLALSAQEANLIAFVQEQGKIRLILRSPTDSKTEPTQITNWDTLFQYLMPPQENVRKEEPVGETIEIYRGLNKEKMRVTK